MDLYRIYNRDGDLLYVGISYSAIVRQAQHKAAQPWWGDVARIDVQPLGNVPRAEAERIEREAIVTERPRHNKVHNGGTRHQRVTVPPAPRAVVDPSTAEGVRNAFLDVLDALGPYPITRDAIVEAIRDGVRSAVEGSDIAPASADGLYVLMWDQGRQGRIIRRVADGYLVQWFSWATGAPNGSGLVAVERLMADDVRWYEDHGEFLAAGERMMAETDRRELAR
jgi:hypothetical protein